MFRRPALYGVMMLITTLAIAPDIIAKSTPTTPESQSSAGFPASSPDE